MLKYVPKSEFDRILAEDTDNYAKARLFADACRINILYMIQRAGSGHIGSSFSAIDMVVWLHLFGMDRDKDIYFSSKGHDCPALYAVLTALGEMDFDLIHRFRRLGGLPGHPIVNPDHPGIHANTGSLGMGISKAKGMLRAKRLKGEDGRVFVMVGDGELQEGQIWESLTGAANAKLGNLVVVVDQNKIQSDYLVEKTAPIGAVRTKFKAFRWNVLSIGVDDFRWFNAAISELPYITNGRPIVIIAETTKGQGVPFLEEVSKDKSYKYHSGALNEAEYGVALHCLLGKMNFAELEGKDSAVFYLGDGGMPPAIVAEPKVDLISAYSKALVAQAEQNDKIVVLDADLAKDCGLLEFKQRFPKRFIECGIAEQDMVSQASGLALQGYIPICHSFATFLTQRANDQIYNQLTENTKVIYVGFLAGLLPATPGVSHQGIRDIAAMSAMPNLNIYAPGTESDVRQLLEVALGAKESSYIRICSMKVPHLIENPPTLGAQAVQSIFRQGTHACIMAYGPVMLNESLRAAEILLDEGVDIQVMNNPWITMFSEEAAGILDVFPIVLVIDDHYSEGGLADRISNILPIESLGVGRGWPVCGDEAEVLNYHRMDAGAIAATIREALKDARDTSRS